MEATEPTNRRDSHSSTDSVTSFELYNGDSDESKKAETKETLILTDLNFPPLHPRVDARLEELLNEVKEKDDTIRRMETKMKDLVENNMKINAHAANIQRELQAMTIKYADVKGINQYLIDAFKLTIQNERINEEDRLKELEELHMKDMEHFKEEQTQLIEQLKQKHEQELQMLSKPSEPYLLKAEEGLKNLLDANRTDAMMNGVKKLNVLLGNLKKSEEQLRIAAQQISAQQLQKTDGGRARCGIDEDTLFLMNQLEEAKKWTRENKMKREVECNGKAFVKTIKEPQLRGDILSTMADRIESNRIQEEMKREARKVKQWLRESTNYAYDLIISRHGIDNMKKDHPELLDEIEKMEKLIGEFRKNSGYNELIIEIDRYLEHQGGFEEWSQLFEIRYGKLLLVNENQSAARAIRLIPMVIEICEMVLESRFTGRIEREMNRYGNPNMWNKK